MSVCGCVQTCGKSTAVDFSQYRQTPRLSAISGWEGTERAMTMVQLQQLDRRTSIWRDDELPAQDDRVRGVGDPHVQAVYVGATALCCMCVYVWLSLRELCLSRF